MSMYSCRWGVLPVVSDWVLPVVCDWVLPVVCDWVLPVVSDWVFPVVCYWVLPVVCYWVLSVAYQEAHFILIVLLIISFKGSWSVLMCYNCIIRQELVERVIFNIITNYKSIFILLSLTYFFYM